ncbi:XdhC family protein [Flavobacteriaceae bacterium]|nr:XdhC family protein [Flavobacteriaceae bacterium]
MTHEIKNFIELIWKSHQQNIKSILATVVALEGSSYRRPGVRMLIQENGQTFGAVSGGCVEKEVMRQAQSVFDSDIPKIMTYDGRYRLGCEGIIYILIEPVRLSEDLKIKFESVFIQRESFESESFFQLEEGVSEAFGTQFIFSGKRFSLREGLSFSEQHQCFKQSFSPLFQLYLFGAEHDTVSLCKAASNLGWQVTVIAAPDEAKTKDFFEGAHEFITPTFEALNVSSIDSQTAVMLMSHSFNKDVQYLLTLANTQPAYFGILGPKHRRERVLEKALDFNPDLSIEFLENLHGPAGINIGAESAEEIAISILSEILSVTRKQKPVQLKEKKGRIHE